MDNQSVIYTHYEILFSLKKKEFLTHAATWKKPENIMLSKISHSQKDKHSMISLIRSI